MMYVLQNLPYFLILIGPLVFFHELGHFTVAKLCGVRVLKFSLGFGPQLLGFKYGETEYVIAAIPLGGFVKMWGEDPSAELPPEQRRDAFSHQPLYKRAAIVAAGPLANLVLAAVLYSGFYLTGGQDGSTRIGLLVPDEPAARAGLLAGDEVIAVNHQPVRFWTELHDHIQAWAKAEPLALEIKRGSTTQEIEVVPKVVTEKDDLGQPVAHAKIGISPYYIAPLVDVPDAESPAAKAGLMTGDEIVAVDDQPVMTWPDLKTAFEQHANDSQVTVQYLRGEKSQERHTASFAFAKIASDPADAHLRPDPRGLESGLVSYDARVATVKAGSPADKAGLKVGDRLLTVANKKIVAWHFDLAMLNGTDARQDFPLTYMRGHELKTASLHLEIEDGVDELKQPTHAYVFGADNDDRSMREYMTERHYGLVAAVGHGLDQAYTMSKLTLRGVGLMLSGKISSSNVGGPVMLFVVAEKSAERGLATFLTIMAMISVNLGLMNLMPVPVLDGGHLLFIGAEALGRRPVPLKWREYANVFGLAVLFMLMALAFRNDFVRFILG